MTEEDRDRGKEKTITLTNGARVAQLTLWSASSPGRGQSHPATPSPITPFPGELSAEMSRAQSSSWFEEEMGRLGYAQHPQDEYLTGPGCLICFLGRRCQLQDIQSRGVMRSEAWLQNQPLAAKTRNLTITAVRTFFTTVVDADGLPTNPARDAESVKAESSLLIVLYDSEANAMQRTAAEMATRSREPKPVLVLLVLLVLDMGLWAGEMIRQTIQDVEVSSGLCAVIHSRYGHRLHPAMRRKLIASWDLPPLPQAGLARRLDDSAQLLSCSSRDKSSHRGGSEPPGRTSALVEPCNAPLDVRPQSMEELSATHSSPEPLGVSGPGWLAVEPVLEHLVRQPASKKARARGRQRR